MTYHSQHPQFPSLSPHFFLVFLNPILHGLFEAGSTRGGGGGGGGAQSARGLFLWNG